MMIMWIQVQKSQGFHTSTLPVQILSRKWNLLKVKKIMNHQTLKNHSILTDIIQDLEILTKSGHQIEGDPEDFTVDLLHHGVREGVDHSHPLLLRNPQETLTTTVQSLRGIAHDLVLHIPFDIIGHHKDVLTHLLNEDHHWNAHHLLETISHSDSIPHHLDDAENPHHLDTAGNPHHQDDANNLHHLDDADNPHLLDATGNPHHLDTTVDHHHGNVPLHQVTIDTERSHHEDHDHLQ